MAINLRLIVPRCEKLNGLYCNDANNIKERLTILNKSMSRNGIDLIVTSQNYFYFNPPNCVAINNAEQYIRNQIIPLLNKNIKNKIPIALGFDLQTQQRSNPCPSGIDAIVCFLLVDTLNDCFVYNTHIWESWDNNSQETVIQNSFNSQAQQRVIKVNNVEIGLLSCGDIAKGCHENGAILPPVDLYINLSHASINRYNQNLYRIHKSWKKAKHAILTHQVTYQTINKYCNSPIRYPHISPHIQNNIVKCEIDRKLKAIFVDFPF